MAYMPNFPQKTLQSNVNFLCKETGMTHGDVSMKCDGLIGKATISSICAGYTFCSSNSLAALANVFEIEPHQLLNPHLPDIYENLKGQAEERKQEETQ